MFYRRKSYIVKSDFVDTFNKLFVEINLPNQLKYGSKLSGRWMKDNCNDTTEVFAVWEYASKEEYQEIETKIRSDEPHLCRIKSWYDKNGGKDFVYTEKIIEVKNEEIISTV